MIEFRRGKNPPDSTILDNWVFENAIFTDKYSQKLYEALKLLSVNNNLSGKLVSSLESSVTLDERFKITLTSIFYS